GALRVLPEPLDSPLGPVWWLGAVDGRKATQPCHCGWYGSTRRACTCTQSQVERYRGRVSGPLLDRLDLQVEVPALTFEELSGTSDGETTASVRERVIAARNVQLRRGRLNAHLGPTDLRRRVRLSEAARTLLQHAVDRMGLSGRAHDRVLKLALTI